MDSSQEKNTPIKISKNIFDAIQPIKEGKIVVAKTDTIYGILADALNKEAVEKLYQIKGRPEDKPFVILIPSLEELKKFNIIPDKQAEKILNIKGITVIFDVNDPEGEFFYLHRGKNSLAFRIPDEPVFLSFLRELKRPVVAPSANPSGLTPAEDVNKAIEYFQNNVDLYIDSGKVIENIPSTIVKLENGKIKILRQGSKRL
ncbi:L-threonylcarbamoyladenylate synthase [Sulfurihydrogenibium sp.]|uniref:L-threonylcarbamoyladenylate synthase n=1 Tax=Sulfurihydrogenibium sp. TaxID=2053621 RepID=UPI0026091120|nr:L-threonylcarbamoyladenylate synthase [Sulfurihydrogenibium sp.]